ARDNVAEMDNKLFTRVEKFATDHAYMDVDWFADKIEYVGEMTHFTVFRQGKKWSRFKTPLAGEFNVRNCLGVIAAANAWGASHETIAEGLATFKSVRRRMEVKCQARGVTVIDDFAHHPTAVRETLRALRSKYNGSRMVAVFEPRSWSSRLSVFQQEYLAALQLADYAIVSDVFDLEKVDQHGTALNTQMLVKDLTQAGTPSVSFSEVDEIVAHLTREVRAGDVITIMSNGGFGGIHEKLINALGQESAYTAEVS
ncbi:MAG: glutamate ligase domain-containing protein, partial [Pyrinomonadaceae bacterium]